MSRSILMEGAATICTVSILAIILVSVIAFIKWLFTAVRKAIIKNVQPDEDIIVQRRDKVGKFAKKE